MRPPSCRFEVCSLRHQLEQEGVGRLFSAAFGVIGCDGDERNGACEDFLVSERLLMRAAQGDEEAFRELVDPHRRELHFHCYRILGSMQDAEDVLQETLLGAWRGLERFDERASLRAWLYRIATNRCLNALRDAGRRPPSLDLPFDPPEATRVGEPTWLEPYPDVLLEGISDASPGPDARYETRETLELAFIAALQHLPPRQRAALVLRDVLGFHAAEVADMLDSSVDSVKGALKRARATLEQRLPATDRDRSPLPNSPGERELVQRFADAFQTDDINGIVALLTEDAWLTMPPSTLEYQGRLVIASFLRENTNWRRGERYRLVPTRANTQPAFGTYRTDAHAPIAHATGLVVLTLEGKRIAAITQFLNTSILSRFGLPRTIAV
jgi:RNA polymerase sigma-70 factor (TIGR02960 family)